jgi:hypothetical protein
MVINYLGTVASVGTSAFHDPWEQEVINVINLIQLRS